MAATMLDRMEAQRALERLVSPWMRASGLAVEAITDDAVTLRLACQETLAGVGGTLGTPVISACADCAMMLAVVAGMDDGRAVRTMDLTLNHVGPIARGDALLVARIVRAGRSVAFATVEVRDAATGAVAAFASGTYAFL